MTSNVLSMFFKIILKQNQDCIEGGIDRLLSSVFLWKDLPFMTQSFGECGKVNWTCQHFFVTHKLKKKKLLKKILRTFEKNKNTSWYKTLGQGIRNYYLKSILVKVHFVSGILKWLIWTIEKEKNREQKLK